MCGVTAIFSYAPGAPAIDEAELDRISQYMVHRGPDGEGRWVSDDRRVGLAHRRLAIIDPSPAGAQPMSLEAGGGARGGLVVSYNGEIYNYRELRAELESEGRRFRTQSDTEVILHLYDRDGPGMVERLRGMFAIAIHDQNRRSLFLARDPFGIKPLYYADDGETIRAASQVKALRAGGAVATDLDPAAQVGFFMFGSVPEPFTVFKSVKLLESGTWMTVETGGRIERRRYFDFREHLRASERGGAGELAAAVADTVRHHMVADVPVGVFLSAGLDSATVTAHAAEFQGAGLDTLTLGFDEYSGGEFDEVPLAEKVADAYGTQQHTRIIRSADFRPEFERIMKHMDQPSIDGINTYFVAKAASEAGLKVALSGVGGDEIFGGYYTFDQIPKVVNRIGLIPGASGVGRLLRRALSPVLTRVTSPKWASLVEYGADYAGAYLLRRGLFLPWELPAFLDRELVQLGLEGLAPLDALAETVDGIEPGRRSVIALETAWYMGNQLLRDADWAGMAHSLEIRTPLVDSVFFQQVAGSGATKRDFATTPRRPLPAELLDRPKTGFLLPVREWVLGGRPGTQPERGYRGWAKTVFEEAVAA